jgi:hypothetical protein
LDKDAFITRLECLMQKAGSLRKLCDRSKKLLKVLKAGITATAPDIQVTLEREIIWYSFIFHSKF